eukprot:scaffold116259_cov19-Tisochrysis_lutea.AAC.1
MASVQMLGPLLHAIEVCTLASEISPQNRLHADLSTNPRFISSSYIKPRATDKTVAVAVLLLLLTVF